ncbi:RICIN domain-containing protein [Bradyrhizobium sp. BRP22]|uniref:RICIN domain-containing protein n=1 Tax=Bradyrhizobium sp. BRP22 TaxID=2793821 RepID=UPI001CD25921|nr:RICIN domain-containing protein [Bradyrhizobium sp. BRP22]MCA1458798.1 RICIN domain-containing protein [Bradyrhizobium sp. BRP22]
MGRPYLIEYKINADFVLGVENQEESSKLVLCKRSTPFRRILWNMDTGSGAITLNSSSGDLAIAPEGHQLRPAVQLLLWTYNFTNARQHWEFDENPGPIVSVVDARLCITTRGGAVGDGTPIWLNLTDYTAAQQWHFVPLAHLGAA